jgi:hypothetical protein
MKSRFMKHLTYFMVISIAFFDIGYVHATSTTSTTNATS